MFTKVSEGVCLLLKIPVSRVHLVEFLIGGIGVELEGSTVVVHLGKRLLPSTDGIQAFQNVLDIASERCER